jgi:transcriptional regulatory protein RtcR
MPSVPTRRPTPLASSPPPPPPRRLTVLGLLGPTLDIGKDPARWERWRPTVSLCQHPDLVVHRLELLYQRPGTNLAQIVTEDIRAISPETEVRQHLVDMKDPWDFEEVYAALLDFARGYEFDTEANDYLIHITTGTHVAQICLCLLTESRRIPARLIQTSPPKRDQKAHNPAGAYSVIDLDLSRYDSIAARFRHEQTDAVAGLKSGIPTRNPAFNRLIVQLEHVAAHSIDPILLTGPTGAGKSRLAKRIYELKRARHQLEGTLVEVNCATLRGDAAMSTLFGHRKGAFTGAVSDRPGLLRTAHLGLLFLDEIGELGPDEQAMLLRALEEKTFLPMGADKEVASNFQLIAGTNRDLSIAVREGCFREDLLARINLWTFRLPALRDRPEDIEPNLDYELDQFAQRTGRSVRMNTEARTAYLEFATSPAAAWSGNFRDLAASVTRMATLCDISGDAGRISVSIVAEEVARLRSAWAFPREETSDDALDSVLPADRLAAIDPFDRVQLAEVVNTCRRCATLSEAGRRLFAASRQEKRSTNDADRLRKYLSRFNLTFDSVAAPRDAG